MPTNMELETLLHEQIPISKAMGVEVVKQSNSQMVLAAPYEKNINHKKTVFGGSLHTVATLACWSWIYIHLGDLRKNKDIVITHSEIDFFTPIETDFEAICEKPEDEILNWFDQSLERKGRGRIELIAKVMVEKRVAVHYQGIFAVLPKEKGK